MKPLLTIAIPTWNRASYLSTNLKQLRRLCENQPEGLVEIIVSDNCSDDNTSEIVAEFDSLMFPIRYIRNKSNLGWGKNFAQCYAEASGTYVLLLGDDDILVDGAIDLVVSLISSCQYGMVLLTPYGYDYDFRAEYPGCIGYNRVYKNSSDYIIDAGALLTLISACLVNKDIVGPVTVDDFGRMDLAGLHFSLRAILNSRKNLFIRSYLVACKRNNSSNYSFVDVFVKEMWSTLDYYLKPIDNTIIHRLEKRMLFSYYPFYVMLERLAKRESPRRQADIFKQRFGKRWLYRYWIAPILILPKPIALLWGVFTTVVGRVLGGELTRGLAFALFRIKRFIQGKSKITS